MTHRHVWTGAPTWWRCTACYGREAIRACVVLACGEGRCRRCVKPAKRHRRKRRAAGPTGESR